MRDVYTVEPGRQIARNGTLVLRIDKPIVGRDQAGAYVSPTELDEAVHRIVSFMNSKEYQHDHP